MADVSHNLFTAERTNSATRSLVRRQVPWRFTPREGGAVASMVERPRRVRELSVTVASPLWRRKATGGIRRLASLAADACRILLVF